LRTGIRRERPPGRDHAVVGTDLGPQRRPPRVVLRGERWKCESRTNGRYSNSSEQC